MSVNVQALGAKEVMAALEQFVRLEHLGIVTLQLFRIQIPRKHLEIWSWQVVGTKPIGADTLGMKVKLRSLGGKFFAWVYI